ncbi:hypothetical protein PR048_010030 [Dryococelus australis]|uniref:Uncharacterized protein n=1 Tax=Dryococelus australis TaxID=614101 RepID=A0ABQ9I1K3_9NEOP|nr:hypothetical protein PR048_010030 [Dryococelus australis]
MNPRNVRVSSHQVATHCLQRCRTERKSTASVSTEVDSQAFRMLSRIASHVLGFVVCTRFLSSGYLDGCSITPRRPIILPKNVSPKSDPWIAVCFPSCPPPQSGFFDIGQLRFTCQKNSCFPESETNPWPARIRSPMYTRASDVCSLAAAPERSQCYFIPRNMGFATCFLANLLLAERRPGTVAQSSPSTVTADNQRTVDIGKSVHTTVESSLKARLYSPVYTRASDVCLLAAYPESSKCYSTPGSMELATCFLTSLLLAQRRPERVVVQLDHGNVLAFNNGSVRTIPVHTLEIRCRRYSVAGSRTCPENMGSQPNGVLSPPSTVTADNQCVVDVGICEHKTVQSSVLVIELANVTADLTWAHREACLPSSASTSGLQEQLVYALTVRVLPTSHRRVSEEIWAAFNSELSRADKGAEVSMEQHRNARAW